MLAGGVGCHPGSGLNSKLAHRGTWTSPYLSPNPIFLCKMAQATSRSMCLCLKSYCRNWNSFQSPRVVLTLGNELSKETHVLKKQETLLGRGPQAESSGVREPRRTALPCGSQSQILW